MTTGTTNLGAKQGQPALSPCLSPVGRHSTNCNIHMEELLFCPIMADPPIPRASSLRRRPPRPTVEGSSWQRRNSTLSDSLSEARNSIRSSTDDLFLPRVAKGEDPATDESHWHSAPLGLALLPAIAGVFFQNGSVFVTDVTLLVLAAIFLNWSVRLPWYVPMFLCLPKLDPS